MAVSRSPAGSIAFEITEERMFRIPRSAAHDIPGVIRISG